MQKRFFILLSALTALLSGCRTLPQELARYPEVALLPCAPSGDDAGGAGATVVTVPAVLDTADLRPYIAEERWLPLSLDGRAALGQVTKIVGDTARFYILDGQLQQVLRFNADGHCTGLVGHRGDGPTNYSALTDICYDVPSATLSLLDGERGEVIVYDKSRRQTGRSLLPFTGNRLVRVGRGYAVNCPRGDNLEVPAVDGYRLVLTDSLLRPSRKVLGCSPQEREHLHWSVEQPLRTFGSASYYTVLLADTLWQVTDSLLTPRYVLRYEGQPALFSAAERAALSDAALVAAVKDKAYFSGAYVLTPSHACFGINTPQGTRAVFFDESAQKVIVGPRMPLTALGPWFIEVCWPPKGTAPVLHGYKLRTNRPSPNPSQTLPQPLPKGRGVETYER